MGNYLFVYDSEESRKRLVVSGRPGQTFAADPTRPGTSGAAYIAQWSIVCGFILQVIPSSVGKTQPKKKSEFFCEVTLQKCYLHTLGGVFCTIDTAYCAMVIRLVLRVSADE